MVSDNDGNSPYRTGNETAATLSDAKNVLVDRVPYEHAQLWCPTSSSMTQRKIAVQTGAELYPVSAVYGTDKR